MKKDKPHNKSFKRIRETIREEKEKLGDMEAPSRILRRFEQLEKDTNHRETECDLER